MGSRDLNFGLEIDWKSTVFVKKEVQGRLFVLWWIVIDYNDLEPFSVSFIAQNEGLLTSKYVYMNDIRNVFIYVWTDILIFYNSFQYK